MAKSKTNDRKEQITAIVQSYYDQNDFLHYESIEVLIEKALDLFLDSPYTIEEIQQKIEEAIEERRKNLIEKYHSDDMSEVIKDNHEKIYGRLDRIVRELNKEGIDYQLAGALCGYLKYDIESNRCHEDVDFNVNEQDIEKFRAICLRLGLSFEDNRMNSPRVLKDGIPCGEHEIIAREYDSDFHVGVFAFERKDDGTVVNKLYYQDEDGAPCVREEIFLPELAQEVFGGEEIDFRGTTIRITPPEYVYLLKAYTRSKKDMDDIHFLEDKLDPKKLKKLILSSKEQKIIQNVPVNGFPDSELHNPYEDDTSELSLMLDEPQKEEEKNSRKKEGIKVFKKKQQNQQQVQSSSSEEGFISNTIITTLALITFVLCFIGIAVIYLVQM